jgi:hypothetical protein
MALLFSSMLSLINEPTCGAWELSISVGGLLEDAAAARLAGDDGLAEAAAEGSAAAASASVASVLAASVSAVAGAAGVSCGGVAMV